MINHISKEGGTQIRTGDQSFAGSCLTAWPCHLMRLRKALSKKGGIGSRTDPSLFRGFSVNIALMGCALLAYFFEHGAQHIVTCLKHRDKGLHARRAGSECATCIKHLGEVVFFYSNIKSDCQSP